MGEIINNQEVLTDTLRDRPFKYILQSQLPIPNPQLPITNYQSPITNYQFPINDIPAKV
ncbi:MAG: hypothetical protein VKN72_18490 [Nostocales cyanobacterium 94392]|nr:hypothetical protein [Nostocales cyanobacterium 94392]